MGKKYCAAPWKGLQVDVFGDFRVCCAGNVDYFGNLKEKPLDEILQHPKLREIRESIRGGELHEEYCANCISAEAYSGTSERDWHNNTSPNFDCSTADNDYYAPALVDIRWSRTCNLSCNYCGSFSSSTWAQILGENTQKQEREYQEELLAYLQQNIDGVREVSLIGGEPLLMPQNAGLVKILTEKTDVSLITNLNVPLENNKVFKELAKRGNVGWNISIDNIGERFEYVRHGSSWELMLKNIDVVKERVANAGHHIAGIHAVYNLYNCTRLNEFIDWTREINVNINWIPLTAPVALVPRDQNQAIRHLALEELERALSRSDLAQEERNLLLNVHKDMMQNSSEDSESSRLKEHLRNNEFMHHKDKAGQFAELWPELAELL